MFRNLSNPRNQIQGGKSVNINRSSRMVSLNPYPDGRLAGRGQGRLPQNGGSHKEAHQNNKVYVGNLAWGVSWQDLKDHMRAVGEVIRADVMIDSEGRSKGCGIVEYNTASEAQMAMDSLTNTELKGRLIFVREDRESKSSPFPFHQQQQSRGAPPLGYTLGGRVPYQAQVAQKVPYTTNQYPGSNTSMKGCRVYVGNISFEVAWQDLKDHMKTVGNVRFADILIEPDGRSKGCGLVEFDSPITAANAITQLNNTMLKGRQIFVREDREENKKHFLSLSSGQSNNKDSTTNGNTGSSGVVAPSAIDRQLYIGNLPFTTTWQSLKDFIKVSYSSNPGSIQRVEIMQDESSGNSKGYGTVRFATAADAQVAMAVLNGSELDGRKIDVRLDKHAT